LGFCIDDDSDGNKNQNLAAIRLNGIESKLQDEDLNQFMHEEEFMFNERSQNQSVDGIADNNDIENNMEDIENNYSALI